MAGYTETQWIAAMIAPLGVVRFIGNNAHGDGSPDAPYGDFETAVAAVPDHTTLIMKAESRCFKKTQRPSGR